MHSLLIDLYAVTLFTINLNPSTAFSIYLYNFLFHRIYYYFLISANDILANLLILILIPHPYF